jgi:uncharacterized damage-inducible protein DinB
MTTHTTPAVDALVYQMESAFAGELWHSVLRNLGSCAPDDWDWTPTGGRRTIRDIVKHIGVCKLRWQNQMFGDHQLVLADFLAMVEPHASGAPGRLLAWLQGVHDELQANVAALTDEDLYRVRPGYWAEPKPLLYTIVVMIEHDLYHAGEINHIRALHQGNDD